MVNQRIDDVVNALKQCKAQGLTYYDATQTLAKQGFNQEEIEQASYQFPYSDAAQPDSNGDASGANLNQAFAEAVVHQEAVDNTKQELHKDIAFGLLGGRGLFGQYFSSKAVSDYAALKDLEKNRQGDPSGQTSSQQSGARVFQRHRAVKYFAILSLLPVVGFLQYIVIVIPKLQQSHQKHLSTIIVPLCAYAAYMSVPLVLFFAKKEATIVKVIYLLMGLEFLIFVAMAILFKSTIFVIVGLVILLSGYWISKRVGLLSQLK